MFRTKDLILMEVIDIEGNKIGYIKDLIIDFYKKEIKGVVIFSYKLFKGNLKVLKEDIISFNIGMVIRKTTEDNSLQFKDIKNMDTINTQGEIIGIIEDILFDEFTFNIKSILVSSGLIKNFLNGKMVLLIDNVILGEENLLYYGENSKVNLVSVPHKLFTEVECHEKEY